MQYSKIITQVARTLAEESSMAIRYNHDHFHDFDNDRNPIIARECRMTVGNTNIDGDGFHVKLLQVGMDTIVPTPEYALNVLLQDKVSNKFVRVCDTVEQALAHAGLNDKYIVTFEAILKEVTQMAVPGKPVIIVGDNDPARGAIAFFVQDEEMVILIKLTK